MKVEYITLQQDFNGNYALVVGFTSSQRVLIEVPLHSDAVEFANYLRGAGDMILAKAGEGKKQLELPPEPPCPSNN